MGKRVNSPSAEHSVALDDLIDRIAPEHVIEQVAKAEGMRTLRDDGLAKVLQGVTSLDEILRVVV